MPSVPAAGSSSPTGKRKQSSYRLVITFHFFLSGSRARGDNFPFVTREPHLTLSREVYCLSRLLCDCFLCVGVAPPAGIDPTRATYVISPPSPISPGQSLATAKGGACGYRKTTEDGRTQDLAQYKLLAQRVQCPPSLQVGLKFCTGVTHSNGKRLCKKM